MANRDTKYFISTCFTFIRVILNIKWERNIFKVKKYFYEIFSIVLHFLNRFI